MASNFAILLDEMKQLVASTGSLVALQEAMVKSIARTLPNYDWVGFYMLDPDDPSTLVLGPFYGAPTPHVRIPLEKGICGAAVARNETIIVEDVASDPRYLSCSIDTRSEIVTPIRVHGRVVGEIDIDSHTLGAFRSDDREFLETCAELIGSYIEGK